MFKIEIQKYKFRPAARLITSIGEGLIKDVPAAIMELVKNAYDADASFVEIEFSYIKGPNQEDDKLKIVVIDNGHGMSFDTVINKWMVPATSDKLKRKRSLIKKRTMQGRKGIGRYASAILGSELNLTTRDLCGNETLAKIDWEEFEKKQFLTDVDIVLQENKSEKVPEVISDLLKNSVSSTLEETLQEMDDENLMMEIVQQISSGTRLEIIGDYSKLSDWTDKRIENMIKDLKKLLSPLKKNESDFKEKFEIKIKFAEFPSEKYRNYELDVAPYPLIEMYDYRIYGQVDDKGYANLYYENNVLGNLIKEPIERFRVFLTNEEKYCGPIDLDLRVFDKDAESIDNLIQKGEGLKDSETGKYLGKLEAKRLIRDISGVGIYRGDFRIRPYGDKGYDWLELDKERVQNPSQRVGNDQIVGFVNIASEEVSALEEKSARDGIKENGYYEGLYRIVKRALSELESRRYVFRRKSGKGRKQTPIQEQLDNLFDFNTLSNKIESKLQTLKVEDKEILEFKKILTKTKEEKTNILEEIQETIAMYQGQATLGKIIMVLQHEGRRPIGYIKNQVPVLEVWIRQIQASGCSEELLLEKLVDRLHSSKKQMEILSKLFTKIDPLSVKKRGDKKRFLVKNVIENVVNLFSNEFEINDINVKVNCNEPAEIFGWESDLTVGLTNIIENSIYWLTNSDLKDKNINIDVFQDGDILIIDVTDNGPGIDESLIEGNSIFEPDFTLKPDGTGLGLAIAGEAIERNGGKLKALNSNDGAYFRLEFKE
ncbi:sensor histidine kinase [Bacillus mycoides]|uniref:sensor histidine kinase n=1 Tax=Bacillus mycoides TaxID=1405 RepID=UPI001C5F08C8|nr:sensor histidine kinase [Bacillus mycoides]